jgi:hypothetical protein
VVKRAHSAHVSECIYGVCTNASSFSLQLVIVQASSAQSDMHNFAP